MPQTTMSVNDPSTRAPMLRTVVEPYPNGLFTIVRFASVSGRRSIETTRVICPRRPMVYARFTGGPPSDMYSDASNCEATFAYWSITLSTKAPRNRSEAIMRGGGSALNVSSDGSLGKTRKALLTALLMNGPVARSRYLQSFERPESYTETI